MPGFRPISSFVKVSAEAYGAWNVKKEFTPPVYPKEDEQKARYTATVDSSCKRCCYVRIKDVLSKSFLFAALDNNDFAIVVDAMKEVRLVCSHWPGLIGISGRRL